MTRRNLPGHFVLKEWGARGTERGIGFCNNTLRLEVTNKLVLRVVQVQLQLIEISYLPSPRGSRPTWSTAGLTLAVAKIFSTIISEQFDSPMDLTLPKQ